MIHYQVIRDEDGKLMSNRSVYACSTPDVNDKPALDTNTCAAGLQVVNGVYSFQLVPGYYYYMYVDGVISEPPIFVDRLYATYYIDITIEAGVDEKQYNYTDLTDLYGDSINTGLITDINHLTVSIARAKNGRGSYVSAYDTTSFTLTKESIGDDDMSEVLVEIKIEVI